MRLKGKHVVITGTSSGIGNALARKCFAAGATVTSLERTQAHLPWTAIEADVTSDDELRGAFERIDAPIDILICNAGVMKRGELLKSSVEDFDALFDVNVKGVWLTVKHALSHLKKNATIVMMSSRHGISLPKNPALYGLTKRCVMDMAEVIAASHPEFTVKVLCPGPVDTPLARVDTTEEEYAKKKRMMCTPEELADRAMKLIAHGEKTRLVFDQKSYTYFMD